MVLLHSPLVGPATTEPLAAALRARGVTANAADLRPAIDRDRTSWHAAVELAARIAAGAEVVVGHSGAGVFLPLVAERIDADAIVFVDATVPEVEGASTPSAEFVAFLDTHVDADGRIARWDEWWPPGTMEELVPDATQRGLVTADIPRVPRSFYDEPVPLPSHWTARRCAYLQLSAPYADDLERARRFGWPTRRRDGQHLDLVTSADVVATDVIDLLSAGGRSPQR